MAPTNNHEFLLSKSRDYISFMSKMGTSDDLSYEQDIHVLFASNLQKIANGKPLLQGIENLSAQLSNAREKCGTAKIDLSKTIVSESDNSSTLQFKFTSELIGDYITTAILHFNENGQIDEINEVFHIFNDGW